LQKQVALNKGQVEAMAQVESKVLELQRKYDESKKQYFKVREERERLKAELAP
jgi:hypothetical protein